MCTTYWKVQFTESTWIFRFFSTERFVQWSMLMPSTPFMVPCWEKRIETAAEQLNWKFCEGWRGDLTPSWLQTWTISRLFFWPQQSGLKKPEHYAEGTPGPLLPSIVEIFLPSLKILPHKLCLFVYCCAAVLGKLSAVSSLICFNGCMHYWSLIVDLITATKPKILLFLR